MTVIKDYRISLRLKGPVSTPLHSGTLFGHLCWAWRELSGEAALEAWLGRLESEPFLISDAFPEGWLPRPLLRPSRGGAKPIRDREELKGANETKELRKQCWIRVEDFLSLGDRMSEENVSQRLQAAFQAGKKGPHGLRPHRAAHNTIDRLTGTTPEAGGLYFMEEGWPKEGESDRLALYVRCGLDAGRLGELFECVGRHGYGKDASIGRGQFEAAVQDAPGGLLDGPGKRRMSLSHGSLTGNMTEARYRVQVHYGKTGSLYAIGGNPFKHPMTLLRPGATFRPEGEGPFGELLRGVHKDYDKIVHNAWHLTAPYTEVE